MGVRAFHLRTRREVEIFFRRGESDLVLEDQIEFVAGVKDRRVDHAVSGIEEKPRGTERLEIGRGGRVDAMIIAVFRRSIGIGKTAGDRARPDDEIILLRGVVGNFRCPGIAGSGLVHHHRDRLDIGPVEQIARAAVADGSLVPRIGPDETEDVVRPEQQARIAHDVLFSADGGREITFAAVERFPMIAVAAPGEMKAVFAVAGEVRKEVTVFREVHGGRRGVRLCSA